MWHIPLIIKIAVVAFILFYHHLSKRYIRGVLLTGLAWLWLSGIDEFIIAPALFVLYGVTGIVIYYIALAALTFLVWRYVKA